MPLNPEVIATRIDLRIAELRVVAASSFVQLSRHGSGGALPHACAVASTRRPRSAPMAWPAARWRRVFEVLVHP